MANENIGIVTMYDSSTQIFNPPKENETYDWPTDDFKITNWNTWMRALAYWLRDKFDFTINSGPGTSMGKVGIQVDNGSLFYGNNMIYERTSNTKAGMDNDWTNSNYGIYPIEAWNNYRAESPFRPCQINGKYYYSTDGVTWDAQWKSEEQGQSPFDDKNNRFDIILTLKHFNNLGLRFKYPLTTTGAKARVSSVISFINGNNDSWANNTWYTGYNNDTIIFPGMVPTLNKSQIALLEDTGMSSGYAMNEDKLNTFTTGYYYYPYLGFITLLNNNKRKYVSQRWYYETDNGNVDNSHKFQYNGLTYNTNVRVTYPWTDDFLAHINNTNVLFSNFINFNKIKYYKSYDNTTLCISIINDSGSILTQFVFYKNKNNTSGLLIAEDWKYTRNNSRNWYKNTANNKKYWSCVKQNNDASNYGNLGNIIVSSNNSNSFSNYIVYPVKNFIDTLDANNPQIDNNGLWKIENFIGIPSENTYSTNLYLVTRRGIENLLTNEYYITKKVDNKNTKFVVFPFNSSNIGEIENETSYLIAIPIEQEE